MTIGIVGGLGHRAGAAFYMELIARTPAADERHHLPVVLQSSPDLPDRIAHLLGRGPTPVPGLVAVVRQLAACGARLICIPSATTHAYLDELQDASAVPVVDLLAETAGVLASSPVRRVAVLGTSATASLGLFERHLPGHVTLLHPDAPSQRRVEGVIRGLKRNGALPSLAAEVDRLIHAPWASEADAILLGCTELHLVASALDRSPAPIFDITTVLADAVLRESVHLTAHDLQEA